MIPDFTNLLTAIVSGDGAGALGTVGKKMQRKTPGLMPSQSILTDIGEGMKHAADRNTVAPEHTQTVQAKTPWQSTNVGKGGMGVLGNVSNTLNDMVNQPMSAPQQIDDGSYAQQVVAKYQMPRLANGGVVRPGQSAWVGDGGKDKDAVERLDVLEDGTAVVTPIQTVIQNRPLEPMPAPPSGLPTQFSEENIPVDINDNNPVLQADEIAANAKRDEIAQASVVGQNKWKDIGYGILQGVANAVAGTNKPIQTYGEVKRDRRVRQLAPQLQMLEDKVKTRQESEKAQQAVIKARQDAEIAKVKYFSDLQKLKTDAFANDADWLLALKTDHITPAQVARLNTKHGTNLTPSDWRKLVLQTRNGQTLGAKEGSGDFRPVTSLPVERKDAEVGIVMPDGSVQYTTSQDATRQQTDRAVANANQAVGIAKFDAGNKIEIDKKNADLQSNYQKQMNDAIFDVAKASADQTSKSAKVRGAVSEMEAAWATLASLTNAEAQDTEEHRKAQAAYGAAAGKYQEAIGETDAGRERIEAIKKAQSRIQRPPRIPYTTVGKVPTVGNVTTTKTASKQDVKDYAKQYKIDIKAAEEAFKAKGYKIN